MSVKYLYINSDYITEYLEPNDVMIPTTNQRNGFDVISMLLLNISENEC